MNEFTIIRVQQIVGPNIQLTFSGKPGPGEYGYKWERYKVLVQHLSFIFVCYVDMYDGKITKIELPIHSFTPDASYDLMCTNENFMDELERAVADAMWMKIT